MDTRAAMKLHDVTRAPNPRRVRVFLAEKGIARPLISVDIQALKHKSGRFSASNPGQRVPALELDQGTVSWHAAVLARPRAAA